MKKLLLILTLLFSVNVFAQTPTENQQSVADAFVQRCKEMLPMGLSELISWDDVALTDDNYLELDYSLHLESALLEYLKDMNLLDERRVAAVFDVSGTTFWRALSQSGVGLMANYYDSQKSKLFGFKLSPKELERLVDRYEKGKVKPYTFLERMAIEVALMKNHLPIKMDENIYFMDMYVHKKEIVLEYKMNTTLSTKARTKEQKRKVEEAAKNLLKIHLVNGLTEVNLHQMREEKVQLVCVIKNALGEELLRVKTDFDNSKE